MVDKSQRRLAFLWSVAIVFAGLTLFELFFLFPQQTTLAPYVGFEMARWTYRVGILGILGHALILLASGWRMRLKKQGRAPLELVYLLLLASCRS